MTAGGMRRLGTPRRVDVVEHEGFPTRVAGRAVEAVSEDWLVEDRWWTGRPLRRRYFELVLSGGANAVVYRDLVADGWFAQRA